MDINRLIKKIKMDLGLNGTLSNMVDDDEIYDIIDLKTRETFSRFFKHVFVIKQISFNDGNRSRRNPNIFRLPDNIINTVEKMDVSINGIKGIEKMKDTGNGLMLNQGMAFLPGHGGSVNGFMGASMVRAGYDQARGDVLNSPIQAEYVEPYSIRIKQNYYEVEDSYFQLELFSDHPKNLSTIKDSYAETFEKLAKLDVKMVLWESYMGYLNDVDLGHTQVDLKKDDWANASSEREQMVEEFREVFISDYPTILVV